MGKATQNGPTIHLLSATWHGRAETMYRWAETIGADDAHDTYRCIHDNQNPTWVLARRWHLPQARPLLPRCRSQQHLHKTTTRREKSKQGSQEGSKAAGKEKFLRVGIEKCRCGVVCHRRSSHHGQRRPMRDLLTETTARGRFHCKWKQPQRTWSPIRGRHGLVRPWA